MPDTSDRHPSEHYLNYEKISQFDNIRIDNQGLLDASGFAQGKINLQGRNVSIEDGAALMITNWGDAPTGTLQIRATDLVNLRGISDFSQFSREKLNSNTVIRGIYSQTFSPGKGADISISAKELIVQNFSTINALSFGAGEGGSLRLRVTENLIIDSNNPLLAFFPSSIASLGTGSGKAGDLLISGQRLLIQNGGLLLSQTLGVGEGGQIEIGVSDLVQVSGAIAVNRERTEFIPSLIGSATFFSQNSGNVVISSDKIRVDSGGLINANTNATGNAGNITIETNSLEISGQIPSLGGELTVASQISSSADRPTPFFLELFNLSPIPTGNAGSVEIKTKHLTISHGGLINVTNEGTGNAGNININADKIELDGGNISAATVSGKGGNINLQTKDLSLIDNSKISATAGGAGDGGNIVINSDSLLMKNSEIRADAFEGNGGKILINTEVFLVSSDSEITATSELGVDGTVEINTPERNLESIIRPVRATIRDVNLNVIQLCVNDKGEEALVVMKVEGFPGLPLEEKPSQYHHPDLPQFVEIDDHISREDREFYLNRVSGNAIVQTEDGEIKYVNLCLRDLIEEQEKLRFEEKQKSQNNR